MYGYRLFTPMGDDDGELQLAIPTVNPRETLHAVTSKEIILGRRNESHAASKRSTRWDCRGREEPAPRLPRRHGTGSLAAGHGTSTAVVPDLAGRERYRSAYGSDDVADCSTGLGRVGSVVEERGVRCAGHDAVDAVRRKRGELVLS